MHLGTLLSAASFIVVAYIGCNKYLAVALFCIGSVGVGIYQSGYAVNHLDIAPKYAGVIFGIGNMFATSTGFLSPSVVGLLTEGNVSIHDCIPLSWGCNNMNI